MISTFALATAVVALVLSWRWLRGGRLSERTAARRRRRFADGASVSIPVLVQAHLAPPPFEPPVGFGGLIRVSVQKGISPSLAKGNLALTKADFPQLWATWAQGRASGAITGRVLDNRYWYTSISSRIPANECLLLLMNHSDWELLEAVM